MKIRADFVTNSSSSSYCAITINGGQGDALGRSRRFELECLGFYTFWFHDPEKMLAECKSVEDLKKAIVYSLGGKDVNEALLDKGLSNIVDFDTIESIKIDCHEEIADRDWSDPWPRDVWYTYDFKSGVKTANSDCPWQRYKGYGDSLAPDVRDADGNQLPFSVEEYKDRQCVLACETEDSELVIPETVTVNGASVTIQGLGRGCFDDTYGVQMIRLPKTIEYIAPDAFEGCGESLKQVTVDGFDAEKPFVNIEGSKLNLVVFGGQEYVIPEDVDELGEAAFGGCWNLKTIVLHDGMKKPTKAALSSAPTLKEVVLSDGSKISVAEDDSKKCFTASKGVIGFNYKKCAELMLEAGNAAEFKWAVDAGEITGGPLDDFYGKIKLKRKPEFKEMKDFLLERLGAGKKTQGGKKNASKEAKAKGKGEKSVNRWSATELKKLWKYENMADGGARIVQYKGNSPIVIVPKQIGKATVTEFQCVLPEYVVYVFLPETVRSIKDQEWGKRIVYASEGSQPYSACSNAGAYVIGLDYDVESAGDYHVRAEAIVAEQKEAFEKSLLEEHGICNFTNGCWYIVKREPDCALIVAIDVLKTPRGSILKMPYNALLHFGEDRWETSSLREWLNGDYLLELDEDIAGRIIERENIVDKVYCLDKVFCLSIDETENLLDPARRTASRSWWLRDLGNYKNASRVSEEGKVDSWGYVQYYEEFGVRPAMWVRL